MQGFAIILSILDGLVASTTNHQGFASSGGHTPFPHRKLRTILIQVSELSHVMDLDLLIGVTQLTFLSQKALDHFTLSAPVGFCRLIVNADPLIGFQRYAAKVSNQSFLRWRALNRHLEDLVGALTGLDGRAISLVNLRARRTIFVRQCPDQ